MYPIIIKEQIVVDDLSVSHFQVSLRRKVVIVLFDETASPIYTK